MKTNPYEILGVSEKSSQDDIKNAYRKLAKKYHPDLNPGNKAAEKQFKELSAAYEKIGSSEDRAKYDRGEFDEQTQQNQAWQGQQRGNFYHRSQQGGGHYTNAFDGIDDDILSSIFGRMHRSADGRVDAPGQDSLYQMEIDFRDGVLGAEREISLPTGKRLHIKIPAGIESGAKLRFAGQGAPGIGKGPPGDAYVQINVRESSTFKRIENNLEIEMPVSFAEALLGAELKVPTIDGSILLKIPAQLSSGQRIRVAGKGVPFLGSTKRGDLFVKLKIVTPPAIDDEFKNAINAWTKRQPFNPRGENHEQAK